MRHLWMATGLVALLMGVGRGQEATPPGPATTPSTVGVKAAPAAEEDPKTAEMRKVFDEFFGEAIKKAQATSDPQDDGRLAEAIYEQAQRQSTYPGFVGYAMDQAVALSENCPGKRHVAYAALADQVQLGIRPAAACYEKMMALGPQVYVEIPIGERRLAWSNQWQDDAWAYANLLVEGAEYGRACAAIKGMRDVLSKHKVTLLSNPLDGALAYLLGVDEQRGTYEAEVAAGKAEPAARLFLGVLALARRDRDQAGMHLGAIGPQGKEFLAAVDAYNAGPSVDASLTVARTAGVLADQDGHPWIRAALLKEGVAQAVSAAGATVEGPNKLRGDLLKGRLQGRLSKTLGVLPVGVDKYLPTLLGRKATVVAAGGGAPADGSRPEESGRQTFFGANIGQAKNVVYVVDRSGSITDSIMYVKHELRRSIKELKPSQKFFVVFYSSGPGVGMPGGKSVPATEANKVAAYEFIESIKPVGQTDPSDALKQAFAAGADTILLLTDGEFEKKIVPLIDTLNVGKKVTVNTVCFLFTGGEAMLQEIAKKNKGQYTFVGESDLKNLGK